MFFLKQDGVSKLRGALISSCLVTTSFVSWFGYADEGRKADHNKTRSYQIPAYGTVR